MAAINERLSSRNSSRPTPTGDFSFNVEKDLIGYAIGKGGANIRQAKAVSKVRDIFVADDGLITVDTDSAEAAEVARAHMEIIRGHVSIRDEERASLIGWSGANFLTHEVAMAKTCARSRRSPEPLRSALETTGS
jgi:polyribonucleotide nucleotidyltransferase